jgi:transposase
MIPVPLGVRVWLAVGHTDMRRGMNGLTLQVQQALGRDPHAGDLYVLRGRRSDLVEIVWHDGLGMPLYAMSAANLRDPQPRLRPRFTGGAASVLVDFGAATLVEAVALISTNLSANATVR